MSIKPIQVNECTCERCGHEWITRSNCAPTTCPKCKSPYWNKPRRTLPRGRRKVGTINV